MELNQDQFFHGTTHAVKDGMVRPANDADKGVSEYSLGDPGDMSEGDHAFAIRNWEGYAWHAANNFHPNMRRSRVYEVEPAHDMKPGPWNPEHPDFVKHVELDVDEDWLNQHPNNREAHEREVAEAKKNHPDEWASKTGFKVKNRIDTMPGHQGTFPDISWGRFSKRPYDQSVNHPSDEAIRVGHEWAYRGESLHNTALKMNAEIDAERNPEHKRQGRSFREFMEGKPVQPNHGHPTLF